MSDIRRVSGLAWLVLTLATPAAAQQPDGPWRGVLDLAGGPLRFQMILRGDSVSQLCNGSRCDRITVPPADGDSVTIEIADYAAVIRARLEGDSLLGYYRNVGNRGPRVIPFHAAPGTWPRGDAPAWLVGRWDAQFITDQRQSPRVLVFRAGPEGLEGTVISNNGDYGVFAGGAVADSFAISHFDGSFVYLLTGRIFGDTLRGTFHAGLRTQTPFVAVRSTGRPHLKPPTEVTRADTSAVFRFRFPDLNGRMVSESDPRFRNKVLLVDIFGTWCPTCHDAAPLLTRLWHRYHARGLEIVGLAYEVSGDSAIDGRQLRIFRDKFQVPYPLLLAGINDTEAAAATQPQLQGFSAFPTSIFIGRDGKVRTVHAGFWGPATGDQQDALEREFARIIEALLAE